MDEDIGVTDVIGGLFAIATMIITLIFAVKVTILMVTGTVNFHTISMDEALQKIKTERKVILYFGYDDCPYCKLAEPIVKELTQEKCVTVFYVKTRDKDHQLTYTDNQREQLSKYISKYMAPNKDEDNKNWLYVPLLVYVENGKVVEGYKGIGNSKPYLNKKQTKRLKKKYSKIITQEHEQRRDTWQWWYVPVSVPL